jgi:hypothetical protein
MVRRSRRPEIPLRSVPLIEEHSGGGLRQVSPCRLKARSKSARWSWRSIILSVGQIESFLAWASTVDDVLNTLRSTGENEVTFVPFELCSSLDLLTENLSVSADEMLARGPF